MKKIITFFVAVILFANSFAVIPINVTPGVMYASQIMIPVGKEGKKISLLELSKISKTDLESITGRKMSAMQSFAFKGAKKKLRKSIDTNGIVTNKKMKKMFSDGEEGFNIGGFALGFLLGLIGVLIAYIINDDKNKVRRKWAWIGFGVFVVLYLILVLAVLNTTTP